MMPAATPPQTDSAAAPPALPDWSRRRPVILQVLPAMQSGGVERGTVEVAEAIIRAGGRALVASNGGRMTAQLEKLGAAHIRMPLHSKNPVTIWRNIGRLRRLIAEQGVDLVHARSRAPAWSAWRACHATGTLFVTTFHAAYGIGSRFKRLYNSVMGRGHHVIAISDFVAGYMKRHYGIADADMTVIPRAVDVEAFDPAHVSAGRIAALAENWRIADDRPVIMMPGRISRIKGHDILIEALGKLKERELFQCVIVGGDQGRRRFREELEARIGELDLDGHVKFVRHCNDMPAAFMLADVVTVPSRKPEGFGRVTVEAQAMGRPVIVAGHGAGPETVRHGETGWITPPHDAEALAETLETALSLTEEQRATLAEKARAFVLNGLTAAHLTAATLAIYDRLLMGRGR